MWIVLICMASMLLVPAWAGAEPPPSAPPSVIFPLDSWVTADAAPTPVLRAPSGSAIRLLLENEVVAEAVGAGETNVRMELQEPLAPGVYRFAAEYEVQGHSASPRVELPPIVVVPHLPIAVGDAVSAMKAIGSTADRQLAERLLSWVGPQAVAGGAPELEQALVLTADNGDLTSTVTVSVADRYGAPISTLTYDQFMLVFEGGEEYRPSNEDWIQIADGVYEVLYSRNGEPFRRSADVFVGSALLAANANVEAGYDYVPSFEATVTTDTYVPLPAMIPAFLRDMTEMQAFVVWEDEEGNVVTEADTSTPGIFHFQGVVNGYNGSVTFTLTVEGPGGPYIVSIPSMTANTVTGDVYATFTLPTHVTAFWSNETESLIPVVWRDSQGNDITTVPIHQAGTFSYYGEVSGYYEEVLFALTVTDASMYRIVLTWNAEPRDLDSHLFGQLSDQETFHIYYADMAYYSNGQLVAHLERDDTDGHGPETTTFYLTGVTGSYRFVVHRWSSSGTLTSSGAIVKLYRGDELLADFHAASATAVGGATTESARYWDVFQLVDGMLTPIMSLQDDRPL